MFFYWASAPQPFDKRIDVAVYDKGDTEVVVGEVDLVDGYSVRFHEVDSIEQLERNMGYKELGVVIPADFDQGLALGAGVTLPGYALWVDRGVVSEMEATYSEKFTELRRTRPWKRCWSRQPAPGKWSWARLWQAPFTSCSAAVCFLASTGRP